LEHLILGHQEYKSNKPTREPAWARKTKGQKGTWLEHWKLAHQEIEIQFGLA